MDYVYRVTFKINFKISTSNVVSRSPSLMHARARSLVKRGSVPAKRYVMDARVFKFDPTALPIHVGVYMYPIDMQT
jgi:hypothetical protein